MEMKIGPIGILPAGAAADPLIAAQMVARMPTGKEAAAVKKVSKEFETLFIDMMLKSMRESVGKDKITDGGHGEEVYRSMLDQEYAKSLTERGGLGLAAIFEGQLAKSRGMSHYDKTNQQATTEVTYENR